MVREFRLINADVLEGLRQLPDESVNCCVTSPPYWGLRDYGTAKWEGGDPECDHSGVARRCDKPGRNDKQSTQKGSSSDRVSRECLLCGEGPYCPYCQQAHREWRANPESFDIRAHGLRCKPDVADQRAARASLEVHPVCKCDGTLRRRCNRCMAKMGADDAVMEEVLEHAVEKDT